MGSADNSDEIRCSHFSSHVGIDSGAVGVLPSSLFELRNRADPVRAGASTASFPRSALTRFTEFLPSCFRRLRSVVFFFFGGGGCFFLRSHRRVVEFQRRQLRSWPGSASSKKK